MFDINFETISTPRKDDEEECKGLIYRCSVNKYINSQNAYVETIRMTPLIRKSCKGCEKCDWLHEYMHEDVSNLYYDESLFTEVSPVHGAVYSYHVTSMSRDWESGHTEIDEVGFVLQKGEK
jgi:hypothetical protein